MSTRDIYPAEDGLRFYAKLAGKPYQPANGTEGEIFMGRHCYCCTRDSEGSPCDILTATMIFDRDDPEYPKEWVYTDRGQPTCTAFDERKEGRA